MRLVQCMKMIMLKKIDYEGPRESKGENNTLQLDSFIEAGQRAENSPQNMARMATGMIKDLSKVFPEINPKEKPSQVTSKFKIRSQEKVIFRKVKEMKKNKTVAIAHDGRISDTLVRGV